MRKFHPLNWIQWLTLALAVCVAATTPVLYFRIQNVQHHENDALQSIICHAEHVIRTQPGFTAKKRREALRFYESSLKDAHLKSCS